MLDYCDTYKDFLIYPFIIILVFRLLFLKNKFLIIGYHLTIFIFLFMMSIGGGQAINDSYKRLQQFIVLENNNELEVAKHNLDNFDSMFQIDLGQFNSAKEFKKYIKEQDIFVDELEAMFIAWCFALLTEISMIIVTLINYLGLFFKRPTKRSKNEI